MRNTLRPLNVLRVLGAIPAPVPPVTVMPLRLTNVGSSNVQISFTKSADEVDLKYRVVGTTNWLNFPYAYYEMGEGVAIELRGNNATRSGSLGNFSIAGGNVEASGSIMSLIYGSELNEDNNTDLASVTFNGLFQGCDKLITPPELPALRVPDSAYLGMFNGCTGLTIAPELPATNVGQYAYENMFVGCVSLTSAPALNATALGNGAYAAMFDGCTGITRIPDLPRASLPQAVYRNMFRGCGISEPVVLRCTSINRYSIALMFANCAQIAEIEVHFTSWGDSTAAYNWLLNAPATGTFRCPAALDTSIRDASHIPAGWTIETF